MVKNNNNKKQKAPRRAQRRRTPVAAPAAPHPPPQQPPQQPAPQPQRVIHNFLSYDTIIEKLTLLLAQFYYLHGEHQAALRNYLRVKVLEFNEYLYLYKHIDEIIQ